MIHSPIRPTQCLKHPTVTAFALIVSKVSFEVDFFKETATTIYLCELDTSFFSVHSFKGDK